LAPVKVLCSLRDKLAGHGGDAAMHANVVAQQDDFLPILLGNVTVYHITFDYV
jgi:hypothetical protein